MVKNIIKFFNPPPRKPRTLGSKWFGYKFFSKYFNRYCIVTRYEDDENWWFITEASDGTLKAKVPLSEIRKIMEG